MQKDSVTSNKEIKRIDNSHQQEKVSDIEKDNLKNVANRMCIQFTLAKKYGAKDLISKIDDIVISYLGLDKSKKNKKEIINFWNSKSEYLICDEGKRKDRNTEHVLKRAIYLEYYPELFFSYLMRFKEPQIDFNAIEKINGENETILDYLDKLISTERVEDLYDIENVKKLRRILASPRFGAKTAEQLKN
ncbi:hypothetical protein [uncultured Algibacter sp.]|uniref:hypothetical protein n=1 Tax=uncultured Algibacter sp. TaxID=298659 RepID=UPI00260682B3|nr:hypothetical protein [uncultured Algibacter sp.]